MNTVLLTLLLKSVVLSVVAVTITLLLKRYAARRVSAAMRHTIGIGTFMGLALLPVLSGVLPAWHVAPPVTSVTLPIPIRPSRLETADPATQNVAPVKITSPENVPGPSYTSDAKAPAPPASAPLAVEGVARPENVPFLPIYFAVSLLLLLRIAMGHVGIWYKVRRATRVDGIDSRIAPVRESPEFAVPLTVGWGRNAVIVLPDGFVASVARERLDAVLAHEAAHIRRNDYVWQTIADVVCAVYFLNPFVWLLARVLRDDAEQSADDCVLLSGAVRPSDYAAHLLETARRLRSGRGVPTFAVTMARRSAVGARIGAIIAVNISRADRLSATVVAGLCLSCTAVAGSVAVLAPAQVFPLPEPSAQPSDPTGYRHTFADGTMVEVVAIYNTNKVGEAQNLWKPDGSSYVGTFTPPYASEYQEPTAKGRTRRTVAIRVTGKRSDADTYAISPYWRANEAMSQINRYGIRRKADPGQIATIAGDFPPNVGSSGIEVRLARTNWVTLTTFAANAFPATRTITPAAMFVNLPPKTVSLNRIEQKSFGTAIELTRPTMPSYDNPASMRIVARLKDGTESVSESGSASSDAWETKEECQFLRVKKDQIASFRLEGRAYDSVTFADVALKPRSSTKVFDAAHTRTLKDGSTFEVLAIAQHPSWKQPGGHWWKPDGTPLVGIPPYAPSPENNGAEDYTRTKFPPRAFDGQKPDMYDIIVRVTGSADKNKRSLQWGHHSMHLYPGTPPDAWSPFFKNGWTGGSSREQIQGDRLVIYSDTCLAVRKGTRQTAFTLELSAGRYQGENTPKQTATIPGIALQPMPQPVEKSAFTQSGGNDRLRAQTQTVDRQTFSDTTRNPMLPQSSSSKSQWKRLDILKRSIDYGAPIWNDLTVLTHMETVTFGTGTDTHFPWTRDTYRQNKTVPFVECVTRLYPTLKTATNGSIADAELQKLRNVKTVLVLKNSRRIEPFMYGFNQSNRLGIFHSSRFRNVVPADISAVELWVDSPSSFRENNSRRIVN